MDRLVAPYSVPWEKADKTNGDGTAQYATDGNPAEAIPATIFPAAAYNAIQDEIIHAIKAFGINPDRKRWDQLAQGIEKLKVNGNFINFMPVEQGGGPNQSNAKINLGWNGSEFLLSVDGKDQGSLARLNAIFGGIKKIGYDTTGPYIIDNNDNLIYILTPLYNKVADLEAKKAERNGAYDTPFNASIFSANDSYQFKNGCGWIAGKAGDENSLQVNGKEFLYLQAGGASNIVLSKQWSTKNNRWEQYNRFEGVNQFNNWALFKDAIELVKDADHPKNALAFSYNDVKRFFLGLTGDQCNDFALTTATDDGQMSKSALITFSRISNAITINGNIIHPNADIAEHYEADNTSYEPGTLMAIGGEKEITLCTDPQDFFGVISTNPSLIMHYHDKETYYPIALTGRIPVRIEGLVKKGQRITVGKNGVAKAKTKDDELTIGRSLEDKTTEKEALITCVVQSIL